MGRYKTDNIEHGASKDARSTTLFQGIFALSKSALGAGALMLGGCMAALGVVPGLLILLVASLFSTSSLHFLSRMAYNLEINDYFILGRLALGVTGELICMSSLILFLAGALIFYIAQSCDMILNFVYYLSPSLKSNTVHTVMLFLTAIIIFPIAMQRDMSALAKTSLAGMACMTFIMLLTLFDAFYDSATRATAVVQMVTPFNASLFFGSFGNIIFTFVNHFTMLPSVNSMTDPTPNRRLSLTIISSMAVLIFNVIFGLSGYLHYGSAIYQQNILLMGNPEGAIMKFAYKIGSLVMGIVLILTIPLLLDPCRGTIEGAIALCTKSSKNSAKSQQTRTMDVSNLTLTGGIILVCTLVVHFFLAKTSLILSLFSIVAGSLLVFIFPPLFFLLLGNRYQISALERGLAYSTILAGLFVGIVCTYYDSMKFFK